MSNGLISRSEVIALLDKSRYENCLDIRDHAYNRRVARIRKSVVELPVVYDVGKVVEQPEDSHNKGCLINRNATIQAVEDVLDDENIDYQPYGLGWRIIERIKNMHTAYDVDKVVEQQSIGEWIPCSESLPEPEMPVLFTNKNGQVGIGRLSETGNWCISDSDGRFIVSVIAWQSLPEPYKECEG